MEKLGYNEHTVELAQIAGYMHDMGNCVNRVDHAHSSALMAFQLLREWKVPDEDIAAIVSVKSVSMMKRLEQQSMLYRQH